MSSLLQRAFRGVGASAVQQAMTILIQVAAVPILLSHWGVGVYGAWLILSAVPSYLSLTDFGFGTAASNQMAMRYARGDMDGARASFSASIALAASSAAICAALVLIAATVLPVDHLRGVGALPSGEARLVLIALSLSLLAGMLRTVFYSVLYADGRYPLGIVLLTFCRGLEFFALAGTALLGGQPGQAATAVAGVSLATTAAYGLFVLVSSPWLPLRGLHIRARELKGLVAPSLSFLLFPLASALNIQGVVLVIGLTSSPHAVVVFSTLRTLSRLTVMPLRSLMDAMRPEMSRAYGLGEAQTLRAMTSFLTWVAAWAALAIIAGLSVIGPHLMSAWTTGKVALQWPVYGLLMAASWVQAAAYPSYMLLYASNRHRLISLSYLVINLFVVGLCLLVPSGLIAGHAAVLLLAELAMGGVAVGLSAGMIDSTPWLVLRSVVAPPAHSLAKAMQLAQRVLSRTRGT